MKKALTYCIYGSFINPISDKKATLLTKGAMIFTIDPLTNVSKIIYLGSQLKLPKFEKSAVTILDYSGHIIIPGLYDMHFHWVQDDVSLKPKSNLLNWLKKYTWPHEKKFKDKKFSEKKAKSFSKKLLKNGTVGGAIYASIDAHSVEHALQYFSGKFIVGNVLMTMNSPEYLTQSKENAIKLVKRLSAKFKKNYALTPRFAPTTHPQVMKKAAQIIKKNNSFIQTHLSETENECQYVLDLYRKFKGFEKVKNYTSIYDQCNLVTSKSIFGHGIYLSNQELKLLAEKKSLIAHCPTSNAPLNRDGLGSGLFDFKKAQSLNVNWALASDIGGGPYLSMFDVMKSFVEQNKQKPIKKANYTLALYRSTVVPCKFLKYKNCGDLNIGSEATFLILPKKRIKQGDTAESILERLLKNSSRKNLSLLVKTTVIDGKFHNNW